MNSTEVKEYCEFLENSPRSHFLQSPEWAKIKNNWRNEVILIRDEENKIIGSMSILIQKIPIINRTILYCPRGPICDISNKEVLRKLIDEIKKLAKKEKSFIFRWDPDIPNNNEEFKKIVAENGIKFKNNINHDINKVIQPKYEMILNIKDKTEEELLASFSQKTRYNIRLSIKKGVTFEEGTSSDIEQFFDMLKTTSQRDEFIIRDVSYYKKVYNTMNETGHAKLYFALYNNERIASTLEIIYGNKAWYLYGASLRKYSNVMPNYLLQWEMIKNAKKNGCEYYNFGGASGYMNENTPGYGVFRFKKGFNPEFTEYIDELYIIFKPITNWLFNTANDFRRMVRRQIRKIKSRNEIQ